MFGLADFDLPLAPLHPAPARGPAVHLGELEVLLVRDGVHVFVRPGSALVGQHGRRPADAQPAALVLVDGEGEADPCGLGASLGGEEGGDFLRALFAWGQGRRLSAFDGRVAEVEAGHEDADASDGAGAPEERAGNAGWAGVPAEDYCADG